MDLSNRPGDPGLLCYQRKAENWLFQVDSAGGITFLSGEGKRGWRRLVMAARLHGQVHRGELSSFAPMPSAAGVTMRFDYPLGVSETVTAELLAGSSAMCVTRTFSSSASFPVEVQEVLTLPAGGDDGMVWQGASPAGLNGVHVSNLRQSSRRTGWHYGPYVMPLPFDDRCYGDSEGHPFPAIAIGHGHEWLIEASLQQQVFTQMWELRARQPWVEGQAIFARYAGVGRDGRSQPVTLQPTRNDRVAAVSPAPAGPADNDTSRSSSGQGVCLGSVFYQLGQAGIEYLYDDYLAELAGRHDLRGQRSPMLSQAVYCTWNYTFHANISHDILRRQAQFLQQHLSGVKVFLIDDGYQRSGNTPSYDFGRWYPDPEANVDPARFPQGMKAVADMLSAHGLVPTIWWAPAMGRRNQLVADHPDWLCLDEQGNSWSMDTGPERKAALDFSLPAVRAWVESCLDVIFNRWGYRGMKLDFCTYPFDCKDIRFRHGQGVRWWNWLLATIKRLIPDDGFFQLCGSAPYGNPFMARWCDSHRVGGDIGMGEWSRHVSTSHAPLPLLAVPGRATMLMDVDSAGIRQDMSDQENLSRLNWVLMTGGVVGIGGDLTELNDKQVGWLRKLTDNVDRGYKVRCPDGRAFTGTPLPEVLYIDYPANSPTAKRGIAKHVGFFNWHDQPRTLGYSLAELGIQPGQAMRDFWTGQAVQAVHEQLVASLLARESRVLEVLS